MGNEEHSKNTNWFMDKYPEIASGDVGKFIIVLKQKVFFASGDPMEWFLKLESLSPKDRRDCYTFYIPKEGEFILTR